MYCRLDVTLFMLFFTILTIRVVQFSRVKSGQHFFLDGPLLTLLDAITRIASLLVEALQGGGRTLKSRNFKMGRKRLCLSEYYSIWLMPIFDLPVDTIEVYMGYSHFRKALLRGASMVFVFKPQPHFPCNP